MDFAKYPTCYNFLLMTENFSQKDLDAQINAVCPSYWVCGWYTNPVPASAVPWVDKGYYSDPAATLSSWGYHNTWNLAGGGWTSPQTYQWWRCGWNTFRDHANIVGSNIHEQNYTGSIPGEPNPEVYASGHGHIQTGQLMYIGGMLLTNIYSKKAKHCCSCSA